MNSIVDYKLFCAYNNEQMEDLLSGLRSTSDGWRAIFADAFTSANIRRLAWAIGRTLQTETINKPRAIIAYDTRFMGDFFTQVIAETLTAQGVSCDVVKYPVPTPLLSWFTYYAKYDIGLMVTASHNPSYYNGLKIRMPYGGPPDESVMKKIEMLLPNAPQSVKGQQVINLVDPWNEYVDVIRRKIDLSVIDAASPIVAIDSMHGATAGLLHNILDGTSARVIQVRGNADPLFGGVAPEPKSDTILPLMEAVKQNKCLIGVAHDGDGDRIVAVDPEIGYLSPHDLITLLAFDLAERREFPGSIVASVSTTRRVKSVAQHLGRVYHEVPIGFRYASQIMREETVMIAGEENGGIGLGAHLPERDGTLIAALLVEMISIRKTGAGALLYDIEKKVGPSRFLRRDIPMPIISEEVVKSFATGLAGHIAGNQIMNRSETDGIKLFFEDGSWVLVRAAGTEPIVRIYAEADNTVTCEKLINAVTKQLRSVDIG